MQARRLPQRADAGHARTGELRQRLAAEARSAGAEDHDVGRAGGKLAGGLGGSRRGRRSGPGSRSSGRPPSAWRARSQASASPVRAERIGERRGRDAAGADAFRTRIVDRLDDGHPVSRRL